MSVHPLAGKPPELSMLVNVPRLVSAYYALRPDPAERDQRVSFGTSGHRGSSFRHSFNEAHILAVSQAICAYRRERGIDGPLYLGMDTHALSEPAFATALEVFAGNGVETAIDADLGWTPTPAISRAILKHNAGRRAGLADGVVITPSHNPPDDGGFKYNPPNGGPADSDATKTIERAANELLESDLRGVKRIPYERALSAPTTRRFDYVSAYVGDLESVVDLDVVRGSGVKIGVDPLGGAGIRYWDAIEERYRLGIEVVDRDLDATFRFLSLDWDGKIRMDCSSPYAMAKLIALRDRFDVAIANDTDYDRHGIVTREAGLMNPNHFLAAAIAFLFTHRPDWPATAAVGKTVVSSAVVDRVAAKLGRRLYEVPVGFKWFVDGLFDGSLGFGGEESAGASFLRRDGTVWTTDKDGIVMGLLAAEATARTGRDPGRLYRDLTRELGDPVYERVDAPATPELKAALSAMSPESVGAKELAGEPVTRVLTRAPGNDAPIGGIKVETEGGWFAARPSGTEAVYKIYAESFRGEEGLRRIQEEARAIVARAIGGAA